MFAERFWRHILTRAALGCALSGGVAFAQPSAGTEVVTELRVHGNYSIEDTEILALAAIAVGDRLEPGSETAIVERLQASGWFDRVEVRKRYTSLSQSDRIALILLVTERPAASVANPVLRTLVRVSQQALFLPVLRYDEGLGMTYGARFRLVDVLGEGGTVAIPLTVGGRREAALEVEKELDRGLLDRLRAGVSFARQENQHFRLDDRRNEVWVGADVVQSRVFQGKPAPERLVVVTAEAVTADEPLIRSGVCLLRRCHGGARPTQESHREPRRHC